jgi:hypothetical protein
MTTDNFNVALRVKSSDPDVQANFRRYFRVTLLFEQNRLENQSLNTFYADVIEAERCGPDGFFLTELDQSTYDMSEFYCIP